ncbi:MAG: glycosyltransferase family 2 protein [Sphingobacteriaceae bacterium]|nr:MAG: glycosyltransferase family 2 protein [Sphingobacteriaceae bacterium]
MPVKIDVIILSYAKSDELKQMTIDGIRTLFLSEDPEKIQFEVLVIESNLSLRPYQYANSTTIYPDTSFGYNKYMNIGIRATANNFICLSNNDLVYHKHWATQILKAMEDDPELLSASPYDSIFHKNENFKENQPPLEGYMGVLGGWCIFVKREVFDIIGMLDEKLIFWYCDADYCQSLIKHKVKNCLISSSFVTHLGSSSLTTVDTKEHNRLTQMPRVYYSYKWIHHSYIKYIIQSIGLKLKLFLGSY